MRAQRPLLVCAEAQSVAVGNWAILRIGGCALDRSHAQPALRVVFVIDTIDYLSHERATSRSSNHHQNTSWIQAQQLQVGVSTLQVSGGGTPSREHVACTTAVHTSACMALCNQLPASLELAGSRFRLVFRLTDGSGGRVLSRPFAFIPSALTECGSERAIVWSGAPRPAAAHDHLMERSEVSE